MTAGTRYMAPPKDYSPSELLDPPWVDFVAYPTLVVLAVAAACVFAFIRMRRRRRARSGANG
ncbi:MAG: hypothetical protein OXG99_12140 [Alphaproteobacteria bacterium]|nr:hypothetical protein [Alphaproteobacteria bacterium]